MFFNLAWHLSKLTGGSIEDQLIMYIFAQMRQCKHWVPKIYQCWDDTRNLFRAISGWQVKQNPN